MIEFLSGAFPNLRSLAALATASAVLLPSLALADCNEDIGVLMKKRMADVAALNVISKANGGKLDPVAACPRLKTLAADEAQVVAYMTKNKDWCSIPDDLIGKMNQSHARSSTFAVKACNLIVQMKKMQVQQAQQARAAEEAQQAKLPAGPL